MAAAFAVQVGPFLLFTLWTAVPMPDRRVVEWFAAFGRLHPSGVPLVRDRLVRARWHRRLGALLGALALWAVGARYGVLEAANPPAESLWLLVLGYAGGAVVGELRAVDEPRGTARQAELAPRTVSSYLAPWVLPTTAAIVATSVAGTLAAAVWDSGTSGAEVAVRVAATLAASGAAWWAARRVVRLPVRTPPGTDPYLDDAFRQYSVTTCLAAAGLGSLATSDLASLVFGLLGGWAAVTWTFAHHGVVIVLLQAMKQPVPWTFGPRIRSAWATPSPVTPPGAGAPRST